MKRLKSAAALFIVCVMAFSASACSSKEDTSSSSAASSSAQANDSRPQAIIDADAKLDEIKDFKSTVVTSMASTVDEGTAESTITIEVTGKEDPYAMHMIRTISSTDNGEKLEDVVSDMYVNQNDGEDETYSLYMPLEGEWYKQTVDATSVASVTASFKSLNVMKAIFNFADNFQEAEAEEVNGKEAVKYNAKLSQSSLQSVMKAGNMLEYIQIGDVDLTYLEGIDEYDISVWIEKESGLPVKYSIELSKAVNNIFDILIKTLVEEQGADPESIGELNIDKYNVEAVLYDMGNVDEIVLPDEVLNAKEFSAEDFAKSVEEQNVSQ